MRHLVLSMTFLCIGATDSPGQFITVQGVVYDSLTESVIADAYVFIPDSPVGTGTSERGEFQLSVPDAMRASTVVISCLGYKSKRFPISELTIHPWNRIALTPAVTHLNEVVVTANADSGRLILHEAIRQIEVNYPAKSHLLEGFYREISIRDTIPTRLIEASIEIQEKGYQRKAIDTETLAIDQSKIRVKEMRKSDDLRTYDRWSDAMNKVMGEKNDLYEMLEDNYVRFLGVKSSHFLSNSFLPDYDIYLEGHTTLDGEKVFIVSLESRGDLFFKRQVQFFIHNTSFAFLRIENANLINEKIEQLKYAGILGKYFYYSVVDYRKIGDRYVPFIIRTKKYASNTNPLVSSDSGRSELQYSDLTFLLTDVKTDFEKIKRKELSPNSKDIYNIDTEYDRAFWDHYNMIKLHPIDEKLKAELERERRLETQFKRE